MESVINIQAVLKEIARGDTARFEVIYTHVVDRVFAFVALRTRRRADALEVTQDTFVELYKSLATFRYEHDAAFYAFVFTIARRQLAQYYAKQAKHQTVALVEDVVAGDEVSPLITHEVHRALQALDDRSREIVVLHHFSRYTFAEIAKLINMTESAVRVRHHRARARLALALTH
jgi:RNA polymerase sigma factor (sigma-70 family)